MITQFKLEMEPERSCRPRAEWAYCLYAALLKQAPAGFGREVHRDGATPVSQYLTVNPEERRLLWTVTLLGERSEQELTQVLGEISGMMLDQEQLRLRVTDRTCRTISDVDELFHLAAGAGGVHRLQVRTPAAFKSQKKYVNLPTARLIVQNLIKKWNGCILECTIEDEDGQGTEALAMGLTCRTFRLSSRDYYLKGRPIPGFTGSLTLENHLTGFHREMADALLVFGEYAGIGIKTTLGMGGVTRIPAAEP